MISDKKQIMNKIKQTMYIPPRSKPASFDVKGTLRQLLVEMDECLEKGIDILSDKKKK
jgi:hypothetical protein